MKKQYKYLAICFVIWTAFGLTSCGAAQYGEGNAQQDMTPEGYITQVSELLQAAESYTGKLEVTTKTASESYRTTADISKINNPLKAQMEERYVYGDTRLITEIYMEEVDDIVNLYRQYEGLWTAISLPKSEALKSMRFFDVGVNIQILLQKGTNWKEVERNAQEIVLSGTIPAEAVYDVIHETNLLQLSGINGISKTYFSGAEDLNITLTLNQANIVPLTCKMELSQIQQVVTNNILKELQVSDDGFLLQTYDIQMEVLHINQVPNIEIPKEARNAVNYEQAIMDMNKSDGQAQSKVTIS